MPLYSLTRTYDLVHTVLRDTRFAMPQGIGLVVQGITSGPVWDRVTKLLISSTAPNTTGCAGWYRARSPRAPPYGCAPRAST